MEKMAKEKYSVKSIAFALIIFFALALTVANEALSQLGLQEHYIILFTVTLVLAALLLTRKFWLVLLVVLGVGLNYLPDSVLLSYYVDRDVLIAFICALIVLPSVYDRLAH